TGDRPDGRRFDHLIARQRGQDRGQSSRQHRLSATWWAYQQHVVGAGGRDLERALGVSLPANVREIEIVRGRREGGRGRRERHRVCAVQEIDGVAQGRRGEDLEIVDRERLHVVGERHHERADVLAPAREPDGEHPAHALNLAVQRQLAHDGKWTDAPVDDDPGGRENTERDRQIERGALFAKVGGSQVDRDSLGRERKAGVSDGRAHALAALAYGRVGKTDRREHGQPGTDVDFHADERGLDAHERSGEDSRLHQAILRSAGRRVNVERRIRFRSYWNSTHAL